MRQGDAPPCNPTVRSEHDSVLGRASARPGSVQGLLHADPSPGVRATPQFKAPDNSWCHARCHSDSKQSCPSTRHGLFKDIDVQAKTPGVRSMTIHPLYDNLKLSTFTSLSILE